ncbi:MAG: rod shape-determining protein RodA [Spirosomataceae bacterium]
MQRDIDIKKGIDWTTIWLYVLLLVIGWINIYAAVFDPDNPLGIFSLQHNAGRQVMFMALSVVLIMIILFLDYKIYDAFAYLFYGAWILVLILTIFVAPDIKGSHSWIRMGSFQFQPAELSKIFSALAISKYLSTQGVSLKKGKNLWTAAAMVLLPPVIIILQRETGSALTYGAFLIVFYREGLPGFIPFMGIAAVALFILSLIFDEFYIIAGIVSLGVVFWVFFLKRYQRTRQSFFSIAGVVLLASAFVFGVDYFINHVLEPHQQKRIQVLVNPDADPRGAGWNVTQARIAISSGGFLGKGYLQGTQTKFDFVPEQSTDFIFCTIGEEWGFIGALVLIAIYLILLTRIINLAEKQKTKFAQIYGYCVASYLFFHLLINVGMTIGLMPVIGIPLPFISYGGSALWSFTILLFIFLKLDAHKSYKV